MTADSPPTLLHVHYKLKAQAPGFTDLCYHHEAFCVPLSPPSLAPWKLYVGSHQPKLSASCKGVGGVQPELAVGCSTDSRGLLAKEGARLLGQPARHGLWAAGSSGLTAPQGRHFLEVIRLTPACAPPPGLALAFHDGSVHIVHRLSLQTMAVFYSSVATRAVDEPAIKRPRTTGPAVHFKAMQLSWTSLALVGIDNHGKVSAGLGVSKPPVRWGQEESPPQASLLPGRTWALSSHCRTSACHLFWFHFHGNNVW